MNLIVPIVDGHGEVDAVPKLIHHVFMEANRTVRVNPPIRVKPSSFLQFDDYFDKYVRLAVAKAKEGNGVVLILLDCEDDCPAKRGPEILEECRKIRSDVEFLVALAYREYETWLMYNASELAGHFGLPNRLTCPANPESIRDAKGWFGQHLASGYKETTHQVQLTSKMNLDESRKSHSFNRFYSRLLGL